MTGTKVGKLAGSRLGEIGGAGFKDENAWGALFQTPRLVSLLLSHLICNALMRDPNVSRQRKLSSYRFG
jgi:hypothetical protein